MRHKSPTKIDGFGEKKKHRPTPLVFGDIELYRQQLTERKVKGAIAINGERRSQKTALGASPNRTSKKLRQHPTTTLGAVGRGTTGRLPTRMKTPSCPSSGRKLRIREVSYSTKARVEKG